MCIVTWPFRLVGGLIRMVLRTIMVIVFVLVALVAAVPVGIALAVVLYLRRDAWTLPAYRWARDASGRLGFTPWGPGDGGAA